MCTDNYIYIYTLVFVWLECKAFSDTIENSQNGNLNGTRMHACL